MQQQWLTVLGLGLDFVGFVLLLREWWTAFFHETAEMQAAERRQWEQSLRHFSHSNMPDAHRTHAETSARLYDEMTFRGAQAARKAALGKRRSMFIAATALIIVGFALQIAGAVPACCPPWIVPQT
jgi:hypothetical protein